MAIRKPSEEELQELKEKVRALVESGEAMRNLKESAAKAKAVCKKLQEKRRMKPHQWNRQITI